MEPIVAGLLAGWITLLVLAMPWVVKGRLDELGTRLERVDVDVQHIRVDHGAELRALRSDVTQIAIALGARGRPETG